MTLLEIPLVTLTGEGADEGEAVYRVEGGLCIFGIS